MGRLITLRGEHSGAFAAILCAAHLTVDYCCILLMLRLAHGHFGAPGLMWWQYALLYNFCAFALQLPLGIVLDYLRGCHKCAAAGCALVFAAWLLPLPPLIRCITAGVGNSLFHIGGGVHILRAAPSGRSRDIGVFVSTGAMGVFLAHRTLPGDGVPLALSAACCAAILLFGCDTEAKTSPPTPLRLNGALAVLCLTLTVFLRGLIGGAVSYQWASPVFPWLMALATVGGKAAGGFLGDRLGKRKAAAASLTPAAALFGLSFFAPVLGLAAVFMFQMTMPLTVTGLSRHTDGRFGLSFGLTTLALFIGTLPSLLKADGAVFTPAGLISGCLLSLVFLCVGLSIKERTKNYEEN